MAADRTADEGAAEDRAFARYRDGGDPGQRPLLARRVPSSDTDDVASTVVGPWLTPVGKTERVHVALPRHGTLHCTVLRHDGTPAANVRIGVSREPDVFLTLPKSVTTIGDGVATFARMIRRTTRCTRCRSRARRSASSTSRSRVARTRASRCACPSRRMAAPC